MKNILIGAAVMAILSAPTFAVPEWADLGVHDVSFYVYKGVNTKIGETCVVSFSMLDVETMTSFSGNYGDSLEPYRNMAEVSFMGGFYSGDLMGAKARSSYFSNTMVFILKDKVTYKVKLKGDSLNSIDSVSFSKKSGFNSTPEIFECGKLSFVRKGLSTKQYVIQGTRGGHQ